MESCNHVIMSARVYVSTPADDGSFTHWLTRGRASHARARLRKFPRLIRRSRPHPPTQYRAFLLEHLLNVKSRHWDESVRLLAAQSAAKVPPPVLAAAH